MSRPSVNASHTAAAVLVGCIALGWTLPARAEGGGLSSKSKGGLSSKGGELSKGGGGHSSSQKAKSSGRTSSGHTKASSASGSRSSHSSSSSHGGGQGGGHAVESSYAPFPPTYEDGTSASDVAKRGPYVSEATFARMDCRSQEVAQGRVVYQCEDGWYERLLYGDNPLYVAVFAPAGAGLAELPADAEPIRSAGATYYVSADAIYAPVDGGREGYVAVEPSEGFRLDALPAPARRTIPIVAAGQTYYRFLGVFYREVHEDGATYYLAGGSPF